MGRDRITNIHIAGFKAIDEADIPLTVGQSRPALKVLIGENGSGKSTVLEALAIVSYATQRATHVTEIIERGYGRIPSILRRGSQALRLEVTVEGDGRTLRYGFAVGLAGVDAVIVDEWLCEGPRGLDVPEDHRLLSRKKNQAHYRTKDNKWDTMSLGEQALSAPFVGAAASPELERVLRALDGIEVHPPFDVRPIWQQKELKVSDGPRWPTPLEPVERLHRYVADRLGKARP